MRIKIAFKSAFCFETMIPVRITDINYGGHVGNDSILSIMHEARLQFLKKGGFTELNCGGCGLIMADSAIQYKGEAFYGDDLRVQLSIENVGGSSFDIFYKITTKGEAISKDVAFAKTAMICFDYSNRKMIAMPKALEQWIFSTT